jgi:hypothetical protein
LLALLTIGCWLVAISDVCMNHWLLAGTINCCWVGWDFYLQGFKTSSPFLAEMLIHFRFGEIWALICHKISKGYAGFFREFLYLLVEFFLFI